MRGRWITACAVAEAVGMAASAGAARASEHLGTGAGLVAVIGGGLVEGTSLGLLTAHVLRDVLGPRRPLWVLATVFAAGLGWAAGSAPTVLAGDTDSASPPIPLVMLGALGIGLALGPLLGLAQALALRTRVRHPFRWVAANAAGWAVAMPLVFLGATTAGADWSWPLLVAYGGLTGAVAGAALGVVTGAWLPTLDSSPLSHRLVLRYLLARRSPARGGLTALAVRGRCTGRTLRFPVMTAPLGAGSLVVLPGHPERKQWWRNLRGGAAVQVFDRGTWALAEGNVLEQGSLEWSVARSAYIARWRRAKVGPGPLVVITLEPDAGFRDQGPSTAGPAAVSGRRRRP